MNRKNTVDICYKKIVDIFYINKNECIQPGENEEVLLKTTFKSSEGGAGDWRSREIKWSLWFVELGLGGGGVGSKEDDDCNVKKSHWNSRLITVWTWCSHCLRFVAIIMRENILNFHVTALLAEIKTSRRKPIQRNLSPAALRRTNIWISIWNVSHCNCKGILFLNGFFWVKCLVRSTLYPRLRKENSQR